MPHEVIMPALGMTQDTGLIVSWLKQPGDAIKTGDAIMEVETDKATMEVEALADGFLTNVTARAGDDVPVGDVIALISKHPGDDDSIAEPGHSGDEEATNSAQKNNPESKTAELATSKPVAPPNDVAARPLTPLNHTDGKILASPKAKRLARERGLDLSLLTASGALQPFHVADLETLKALPAGSENWTVAGYGQGIRLRAKVKAKHLDAFMNFLGQEGASGVDRSTVLAAFAAASLRKATDLNSVAAFVKTSGGVEPQTFVDPDLAGLSDIMQSNDDQTPDLIIHDLTQSTIDRILPETHAVPVVAITARKKSFVITLACQMDERAAITLLNEFAGRLNDPLRHLL